MIKYVRVLPVIIAILILQGCASNWTEEDFLDWQSRQDQSGFYNPSQEYSGVHLNSNQYRVRLGDTVSEIASVQCGDVSLWRDIAGSNNLEIVGSGPNANAKIRPGMILDVGCGGAMVSDAAHRLREIAKSDITKFPPANINLFSSGEDVLKSETSTLFSDSLHPDLGIGDSTGGNKLNRTPNLNGVTLNRTGDLHGNHDVDLYGRLVDEHGQVINQQGYPVDEYGNYSPQPGVWIGPGANVRGSIINRGGEVRIGTIGR